MTQMPWENPDKPIIDNRPKLVSAPIDPELELAAARRRLEYVQKRLYRWTKSTGRRSPNPPRHIVEG